MKALTFVKLAETAKNGVGRPCSLAHFKRTIASAEMLSRIGNRNSATSHNFRVSNTAQKSFLGGRTNVTFFPLLSLENKINV